MHNCETTATETKKRGNNPDNESWEDIKGHRSHVPHILDTDIPPDKPGEMPPVSALIDFPGCTIH